MADITLFQYANGNAQIEGIGGIKTSGPVWTSETTAYHFYINDTSDDLIYIKSTDGGATWGSANTLVTGTIGQFSVWYDAWTSGDTGTIIHVVVMSVPDGVVTYFSFDTSDDSVDSGVTIVDITPNNLANGQYLTTGMDITKSRGGNLYVAAVGRNDASNEFDSIFYKSTNSGVTWDVLTDVYENTGDAANVDRLVLLPANLADNQDIWAVYFDDSATEVSLKTYDDSGNSWAETSISTGITISNASGTGVAYRLRATVRHSDGHAIAVLFRDNGSDATATDLLVYDITDAATITAKTDVLTNAASVFDMTITIDQATDDLYVGYVGGDAGDTFATALGVRYKKSDDGGTTWGSAVEYNEGTDNSFRAIWSGISVNGGRFMLSWADDTDDRHITNQVNSVFLGGSAATNPIDQTLEVIVDFNADDNFSSTEAITLDILNMNWNRGKEPEQELTPVATSVIVVSDPDGNYSPNSTFWGTGNVDVGREVRARTSYQGNMYSLFRHRISRIQPSVNPGKDQTATLFCVDEKEFLNRKNISSPNSAQSSGGTNPDGSDPAEDITFGSTSAGVLKTILDESSLATDRRQISEVGSTAELWWTYGVSAKAALDEVERHEGKRAMLFINSSGSMEFHSSTHRNGAASLATFGNSSGGSSHIKYQNIQFTLSDREVLNAVEITHVSYQTQLNTPQFIAKPGRVISTGSTFSWTFILDKAPVSAVLFPRAERDSTSGLTLRGVSGTTYADDSHADLVQYEVFGATQIKATIINPGSADGIDESFTVESPSTASYTGPAESFPFLAQLHAVADVSFESCDPTSITRYGRKFKDLKFPFFGVLDGDPAQGKLADRATEEIAHNSTAHPSGVALTLEGTDSDSLLQVLSRDMNDRITINDTATLRLSNQDFYITRGEWNMIPGEHTSVVWSMQEAT